MSSRNAYLALVTIALAGTASAQIATSNEDGATGAYSDEIESSFTSESRFGPRTALDDLRADVDREREAEEKLRQRAARAAAQEEESSTETEEELLDIRPYRPEQPADPVDEE